jgi:alpha-glucan,water dikinase
MYNIAKMLEEIITENSVKLLAEKRDTDGKIEVSLQMKTKENCLLHWGLGKSASATWQIPPQSLWPGGSKAFDQTSVQSPFSNHNGKKQIIIRLDKTMDFSIINFVLFYPDTGQWDNNHGKNYCIKLPEIKGQYLSPVQVLKEEIKDREVLWEDTYDLDGEGRLAVAVSKDGKNYQMIMVTDISGPLVLHWGISLHSPFEWLLPPASTHPAGTIKIGESAVQTPFILHNNLNRLNLQFRGEEAPLGIAFVLQQTGVGRWFKKRGQNFSIPVRGLLQKETYSFTPGLSYVAEKIIQAEMGHHSWTLMHRFNLCHDLLDQVRDDQEALALLFVWLRYSSVRQLSWQRNYNTKPSELCHAQDRLTLKLADSYISEPESRELIRLMITTLGPGGEGQKIRDEILNIMHRHHIKEVSGHFMEEWHQKLHNNATPDDIVICEAYLKFLQSNGDIAVFYKTLEAEGITKERLENFERPIVTPPDFVPHLKEGLIHDFENYLKILNSIHSGTDLESAVNAAGYLLDSEMSEMLEFIFQHRYDDMIPVADIVEKITNARNHLSKPLNSDQGNRRVRDQLYIDLALEELLRVVIERNIHKHIDRDQLVELISMALENLSLSHDNPEISECIRHWKKLKGLPRFSQDWSLHAKSVIDRIGCVIGAFSEHYYRLFQSRAEFLGKAFHADSWAITLFSEEIVRGRLTFLLSMLVHLIEPILRKNAKLGNWQIISPGHAIGKVEVVDTLRSIQGKYFDSPTVIIADKVMGDEEPPEGANAIITPESVDLVSHIAVRTRNSHLLFATCYDKECLDRLKSLKGHLLNIEVKASGDVIFEEVAGEMITAQPQTKVEFKKITKPDFTTYAISSEDFSDRLVGGKSNNLIRLQNKMPDWIHLPVSVALPFGIFEEVLAMDMNREISSHYKELLVRIEENPGKMLSETRKILLALESPEGFFPDILRVMEEAGLGRPDNLDDAWMCIKRVWASKWNERAYLSRKARGIPHGDLLMAVLVQQVIEAEYAFVIHTVNPFTSDKNELYAEVVLGLGETLVGNYPGRALGITFRKETLEPHLLSYPSKSIGLFGGGLIFRSDSNGEDLATYSGAGLYDSFMLAQPRKTVLRYIDEPLVWDVDFRRNILSAIAEIGMIVEKSAGSPQDIEGAYARGRYYIVQTRPQV